jgi:hypothetical protein
LKRPHSAEGSLALFRRCLSLAVALVSLRGATRGFAPGETTSDFVLVDVTERSGISFLHLTGATGRKYLVETMGSGVVFFDYDSDLDPDIYFVNGGALPGFVAAGPIEGALYRNDGRGRFVDETREAGLSHEGYGMGAQAADYDNDGDPDLYVTHFGRDRFFRNNGDGTFSELTEQVGLGNPLWGTAAVWSDLDVDGDLDLYVVNYLDWSLDNNPPCWQRREGGPILSYCLPDAFRGLPDELYRNRGDGTFEAVGRSAGISLPTGKGLGGLSLDENADGLPDLYVANDTVPNFLFRNRGGLRFDEMALELGVAYDASGAALAGMGVDAADIDKDRDLDLIVTNFQGELNTLYRRDPDGFFTDVSVPSGIGLPSLDRLGFGTAFADLDDDSLPDLVVANGQLDSEDVTGTPQAQPNQLFQNLGGGRFREVSPAGGAFDTRKVSRGLAVADVDGDSDLDLLVTNSGDRPDLLRNDTPGGGALRLLLVGRTSNRDAVGARIELDEEGGGRLFELRAGSSYLSQHERILHVGLGPRARVERLRILWPGRNEQVLESLDADQLAVVVEDVGVVASFPFADEVKNRVE